MNQTPDFDRERIRVGDWVGVNDPRYPGRWRVERINPRTITLAPEHGGRGLRAPRWMLDAPPAGSGPAGVPSGIRTLPHLAPGTIVRYADPRAPGLHVVLNDKHDRVNIALLGGNADHPYRYWRALPALITVVSLADAAAHLTGSAPPASREPRPGPDGNGRHLSVVPPPSPDGRLHAACTECGFGFAKPQAKATCNSKAACDRRKSARTAGAR